MACFVINEWLWADVSGQNGRDRPQEAFKLLVKFARSEHRLVIIEGSAFDRKAWQHCKSTEAIPKKIATVYVRMIRLDANRCLVLKPGTAIAIPEDLGGKIKEDDRYLVEALIRVPDAILVTTDEPLRNALAGAGYACISREQFVQGYFGSLTS